MADRTSELSTILSNVEHEISGAPPPTPRSSASVVESFAPQKYRNAQDSLEQIKQDFRKAVSELEQRSKALFDELKRITG